MEPRQVILREYMSYLTPEYVANITAAQMAHLDYLKNELMNSYPIEYEDGKPMVVLSKENDCAVMIGLHTYK